MLRGTKALIHPTSLQRSHFSHQCLSTMFLWVLHSVSLEIHTERPISKKKKEKRKGKWKNKNKNSRILNLWNYHSKNPWIGCPFFTGTSASKDQIWHEIWSGGIRSKSCLSSPCYLRSALDVQCALCALCNAGQLHTTCTSVLRA